jgi:hypothetical protein
MGTQRELAEEERMLYLTTPDAERQGSDHSRYIAAKTGASHYTVEARLFLYLAGAEAEPLWEEIEKKRIKLGQARAILREARSSFVPVTDVLAKYKDSKFNRSEFGTSGVRMMDAAKGAVSKSTLGSWQKIREAVAEIVGEAAIDEDEREDLIKLVIAEIELVITTFRARVGRARTRSVSWAKVREACTLLSIPVPKRGRLCDLVAARKHQRSVMKVSHPDVVGNDSGRGAYEAVAQAYQVLVAYNDSLVRAGREK